MRELRSSTLDRLCFFAVQGSCSTVTNCKDITVARLHLCIAVDAVRVVKVDTSNVKTHAVYVRLASSREQYQVDLQLLCLTFLKQVQLHLRQDVFCLIALLK